MPTKKGKPSSIPKNAIRYAVITAAAISTLIGAQTIAFSEELAKLQAQREQAVTLVVDNTTYVPTSEPTTVNTLASDPTFVIPTLVPLATNATVKLPTAQPTTQPTIQPTLQPTLQPTATQITVQPTQVIAQIAPAVAQPRPQTKSSRP